MQRGSGPDPARGRGTATASNLPVGQAGQPAWEAEAVRTDLGRPIKWRSTAHAHHLCDRRLGRRRG
jgi:hypothetical protein